MIDLAMTSAQVINLHQLCWIGKHMKLNKLIDFHLIDCNYYDYIFFVYHFLNARNYGWTYQWFNYRFMSWLYLFLFFKMSEMVKSIHGSFSKLKVMSCFVCPNSKYIYFNRMSRREGNICQDKVIHNSLFIRFSLD